MDKLVELWKTNKWMFFLLVIPLGLASIYNLLIKMNVSGAKKDVKKAEKKDVELKEKQDKANAVADKLKDEANKIENNIENLKDDEDWNK